ncbi:hypothetical protein [Arenibacter sp. ARW7G5Y1]|uniref:hypothetical protein n=1 Tax=Arenibacter sp. ARW7G5Y1 TaxID=2135619 RepID=UPI000D76ADCE|nr:hypothetical protein [Arenibacter sp. ARW7G5Y1]PXX31217.1 hypothetical protein C7972_10152 [Arenibacter sp. ARW7G5Y1]|tara:strand:- start:4765 stop:5283 length:519 start_codon:yes stop_codon:yes gene_type:complete
MKTLIYILGLLLLTISGNKTKSTSFNSTVLVDGVEETTFDKVASATEKPKMILFYSSENCGPCLEQIANMKPHLSELDKKYQLIFIDSWTIGKAKKHQSRQFAFGFYKEHLKTNTSHFLLDPEDELLASFQEKESLKGALPFLVVQDNVGLDVYQQLGQTNFSEAPNYASLF